MFKATHFIITPKAGSSAYGFGFSKSPKQAVELAKANAGIITMANAPQLVGNAPICWTLAMSESCTKT